MLVGAPVGGSVSDAMGKRLTRSRAEDPYLAIDFVGFAAGCNGVSAVSSWTLPNDLSRRHVGTLSGVLHNCSNIGGALSSVLTPCLATRFGWITALDFAAAFMLGVAPRWLFVHSERGID